MYFNPITYCILRFARHGEEGAFWPLSRKQGYGLRINMKLIPIMVRMILVNMQNFELLAF